MKLYYLPGSCALAPHIALELAGTPYEAVRVERGEQGSPEYLSVNPLGRVPALVTADGSVVTEVPAVLTLIADHFPTARLLPPIGDVQRYRGLTWLAYLSSTVHPAFARLWRSERFTTEATATDSIQAAALQQLDEAFAYIDNVIERGEVSDEKSVSAVDCYLFVFGRWGLRLPRPTQSYPNLYAHTLRMRSVPAVSAALEQQKVTFEGPASGPG